MTNKKLYDLFESIVDKMRLTNNILSFVQNGDYYTVEVDMPIGLIEFDSIEITGTANFNGTYKVLNLSGNTFDIEKTGSFATETGLVNQKKPYFNIGNWLEISNDLKLKGSSKILDSERYPIVILHSDIDYVNDDVKYQTKVNPKFYILAQSQQNYSTLERIINIYEPILNPLYTQFIDLIERSRFIKTNITEGVRHTKKDLYYFNQLGSNQNKVNDIVDCIEVSFSELIINKNYC